MVGTAGTPEVTQGALQELERHKFVRLQMDRNLIWLPGMRELLGAIGPKIRPQIEKYLRGLRACALIKEVADSCGIVYELPEPNSGYPIRPWI